MYLETERLIIRDFDIDDAESLYKIKYDIMVIEYIPSFIKRNANMEDINSEILYFKSVEGTGNYEKEVLYAVILKNGNHLIGAIAVSYHSVLYEPELGWMMQGEYCKKGYASEAATAVTDYLFQTYHYDFISVVMDVDNPASFRTAEKSGFKLFEKRTVYDHKYGRFCDDYYYFRKFNPDSKITNRFYGDTEYDGRHL